MNLSMICCTENKPRYAWETRVLLKSVKQQGYPLDRVHILLYSEEPGLIPEWHNLSIEYPEVGFHIYINPTIKRVGHAFGYPPICRLYCLQEHWKKYPELEKEAIFYCDTDIVFTKYLDFSKFLENDINYVSWTGNIERTDNYLWQPYLDSKLDKVNPWKIEQYKKLDIVERLGKICSISREIITKNNSNTGGAQYILKNITPQFWTDCFNTCCEIKMYLADINQVFMKGNTRQEKEDNGFQSWCADMWAVLYNLWKTSETRTPKELDFAWSTDSISRLEEVYILHNAGVMEDEKIVLANKRDENGNKISIEGPLFHKGSPKYREQSPFDDTQRLTEIYNNPVNKQFCNNYYIAVILNK